jgi:hypothetical protein
MFSSYSRRGRTALGVSLGTILPEERLTAAASWTGKALLIADRLGNRAFLARVLRMHGNELRKAGRPAAAIARLSRAVALSRDHEGQGSAYALLARTAGEQRDRALFDHAIGGYRRLLDSGGCQGLLFNAFTFREIQLRGLASTGRAAEALRLLRTGQPSCAPAAPQWHIIERVTAGQILLTARNRDEAAEVLRTAVTTAETYRMAHQIERVIRAAGKGGLDDVSADGEAALLRLVTSLPGGSR